MLALQQVEDIAKRITEQFPDTKVENFQQNRINLTCPISSLVSLAGYLRDNEGFDHVTSVAGLDYPTKDLLNVTYHLGTYAKQEQRGLLLSITVNLPRQDPRMPTLIPIWQSAEFHERETHEMLGVEFEGHPNMKLLLLPEDWNDPPPLRKEFKLRGR